eukprot:8665242-Pyramimonas_sp.AAC.1
MSTSLATEPKATEQHEHCGSKDAMQHNAMQQQREPPAGDLRRPQGGPRRSPTQAVGTPGR